MAPPPQASSASTVAGDSPAVAPSPLAADTVLEHGSDIHLPPPRDNVDGDGVSQVTHSLALASLEPRDNSASEASAPRGDDEDSTNDDTASGAASGPAGIGDMPIASVANELAQRLVTEVAVSGGSRSSPSPAEDGAAQHSTAPPLLFRPLGAASIPLPAPPAPAPWEAFDAVQISRCNNELLKGHYRKLLNFKISSQARNGYPPGITEAFHPRPKHLYHLRSPSLSSHQ